MRRGTLVVALLAVGAGCATVPKDHAAIPPAAPERATDPACIEGDFANLVRFFTDGEAHVRISEIDGQPVGSWGEYFENCVRPGKHTIGVLAVRGQEGAAGYKTVELAPGRRYHLRGNVSTRSIRAGPIVLQLVDVTTRPHATLAEFELEANFPAAAVAREPALPGTGERRACVSVGKAELPLSAGSYALETFLQSVDGAPVVEAGEYWVEAGRHSLRVGGRYFSISVAETDVELAFEPGRRYRLRADLLGTSVFFKVLDVTAPPPVAVGDFAVLSRAGASQSEVENVSAFWSSTTQIGGEVLGTFLGAVLVALLSLAF